MSAIILEREVIHYEVLGRGRPLILIHGWVGSWRYWVPVMQAASISFRAYALDLWGFGDSARKPDRYTLENQAALLDGFMEEMGLGKVALVGHGLGALVALSFAVSHPDLVDRVMAVSCPIEEASLNGRLRTSPPIALADWLLDRSPASEPARSDAAKTDPLAVQTSFTGVNRVNFKTLWNAASPACLLVHGEKDPAVLSPSPEQLNNFPEKTHAILFEESGHFPMLDTTSSFNRLMTDFLNLTSGESPRDLQLKDEWKRRVR
jgi:pimeloyl-ACP methyl ester carboxylesterase